MQFRGNPLNRLASQDEAEFISLDLAAEEADWLRDFLEYVLMWSKHVPAISIHCDSQSAIDRAQSHIYIGKPDTYVGDIDQSENC